MNRHPKKKNLAYDLKLNHTLNIEYYYKTGWYLTGDGDVSWSLDFGIPLTGTDSNVPGWDTFDPSH